MSINQAKLTHQLILVTNVFLRLINKRKKKAHVDYSIAKAVSETVRKWLTKRN